MMEAFILVKVFRPEGYEDVAPELVLEDFLGSPAGWTTELVEEGNGPQREPDKER